jgi:DNA-binding MarR family transcriptional regulator
MCPKIGSVRWDLLKKLAEKNMSAQELAVEFNLPSGTARAELFFLKKQSLIEPVPQEKRGIPYRITPEGQKRLQQLKEEPT